MRKKYESEELKTIYELTNALCSIDSTIATRSTTADRYWSYILKMWKTHTDAIGCNIMYNILFSIRWGVLPKDTPQKPDLIKLIELAKAEFLKHSQEMRIAKSKNVFKAAYTAVMKSTSPHASPGKHWRSRYFQKFLEDQLQYKLYGGDVIVENLNLVDTPMFEIE